jgi:hypothetical protein
MYVEILKNNGEWNEFLKHSPNGTFFHSLEWREVIKRSFPYRDLYVTTKNSEGKIVGICPGFIKKEMHVRIYDSLPHSDYGGPVIESCYMKRASAFLRGFLESFCYRNNVAYGKICIMDETLERLFQSPLVHIDSSVGVIEVDLKATPSNLIWNKVFDYTQRRKIRVLERDSFRSEMAESMSDLTDFYRLYCSNMQYIGVPPRSYGFMQEMWRVLYPKNIRIWLVGKEKRIGGIVVFKHMQSTYAVYAGINRDKRYSRYSIIPYLLWREIRQAEEEGYRYVSLGTTTSDPNSPYHLQKLGFGGRFRQQRVVRYPFTPIGRLLTRTRSRTVSIWRNVKNFLPRGKSQLLEKRLSRL